MVSVATDRTLRRRRESDASASTVVPSSIDAAHTMSSALSTTSEATARNGLR